jgi:hypothetical protein
MMISYKTAQNVSSEDAGTANHANRIAYAGRVIVGGDNPKNMAAHIIASNGTIQNAITSNPSLFGSNVPDGDIEFAMASIWDARSNAFAAAV